MKLGCDVHTNTLERIGSLLKVLYCIHRNTENLFVVFIRDCCVWHRGDYGH